MSYDDALMDPQKARSYLATRLSEGTIVLFLGAGASHDLGLPEWVEFINQIRADVNLSIISGTPSTLKLQKAADEVRKKCKSEKLYHEILKKYLYKDIPSLSQNILHNDLYISLGGLLMGTGRGSIQRVVTLNFDSMLEWFLRLYGFIFRVIWQLPDLEGSEDVRIYHINGYLPHVSMKMRDSANVILGFDSVKQRLGNPGDLWFEMLRHILYTGVCLFVGLSERTFNDVSMARLLKDTSDKLITKRITGIWLLKKNLPERTKQKFLRTNIVPLEFSNSKEISDFLLEICQIAAAGKQI